MFRFGYEDGCYEHISLIKAGEDNRLILRKKKFCLLGACSHTAHDFFYILFGWCFVSEECWARYCCFFDALEIDSYPLSLHTTTFVLFLSYENPTNCSFHRILITQIHNEGNKVQALSWADWYSVAWTVQNLWRIWLKHKIEGAVNSPGLGFPKCIPRAINSPPTIKKLRATVVMSLR